VNRNCQTKNILALDTSCGVIAASILQHGQGDMALHDSGNSGKTRSTTIVPMLESLLSQAGLNWQQLDVLAFGAGPGSFTGLRIAAATLAGLNTGLRLPMLHLSSLAITAMQSQSTEPVRVLEDARAGEAFSGYYQHNRRLESDSCQSWAQIDMLRPARYCCHNEPPVPLSGWQRVPLALSRSRALAQVTQHACDHVQDWGALPTYPAPIYLQLSQAERNANGA